MSWPGREGRKGARSDWTLAVLPPFVALVFNLLRMRLNAPTAAGLAFLFAALVTLWLAPRARVSYFKLGLGILLAVLLTILLSLLRA
ncbi:MAG TPA: hypothetical protein VGV59_11180 [Pyrinomonadaceae bacterium]|nr:hypothetical protein [Pyrinomonadaceae bacterium]